jgi:hypothetical protein
VDATKDDLDFDGVVISVPKDVLENCRGLARAISETGRLIGREGNTKLKKIASLERETRIRRHIALGMKLTTLLAGGALVLGYLPGYTRVIGGSILFLSVVDWVAGNQQRLVGAIADIAQHRAVLDVAAGMEMKKIEVTMNARIRPVETLSAYQDYLKGVWEAIQKGGISLRKTIEGREIELAKRLALPEPTIAIAAEGSATKPSAGS